MTSPPSFAQSSLLIAVGGGTGAWLRHLTGRAWLSAIGPAAATAFPWATLTVNVVGSLAMGLLAAWLARHGAPGGLSGEGWRLLLGVGVLGGYTTFSSFTLELVLLVERGSIGLAALYAGVSLAAGFGALILGLHAIRSAA